VEGTAIGWQAGRQAASGSQAACRQANNETPAAGSTIRPRIDDQTPNSKPRAGRLRQRRGDLVRLSEQNHGSISSRYGCTIVSEKIDREKTFANRQLWLMLLAGCLRASLFAKECAASLFGIRGGRRTQTEATHANSDARKQPQPPMPKRDAGAEGELRAQLHDLARSSQVLIQNNRSLARSRSQLQQRVKQYQMQSVVDKKDIILCRHRIADLGERVKQLEAGQRRMSEHLIAVQQQQQQQQQAQTRQRRQSQGQRPEVASAATFVTWRAGTTLSDNEDDDGMLPVPLPTPAAADIGAASPNATPEALDDPYRYHSPSSMSTKRRDSLQKEEKAKPLDEDFFLLLSSSNPQDRSPSSASVAAAASPASSSPLSPSARAANATLPVTATATGNSSGGCDRPRRQAAARVGSYRELPMGQRLTQGMVHRKEAFSQPHLSLRVHGSYTDDWQRQLR
jgi:hypothetical protein